MSGETLFQSWRSADGTVSVFIEASETCCYAYFLRDEKIVGDVWLYNFGHSPVAPPWLEPNAQSRMPFANAEAFCDQAGFDTSVDADEVECEFDREIDPHMARIFIRGTLHAVVGSKMKPGRCRLATRDGPVALAMETGDDRA